MSEKENIRLLQTMLRVIASATGEIPTVIPDGVFGSQTERAVRAFQQAAGLPVTGKVDATTWQSIVIAYERLAPLTAEPAPLRIILQKDAALARGSRNDHIHIVQAMLLALSRHITNLPQIAVTGIYDAATENAVRRFQTLTNLPQTGTVDRTDWKELVSLYRLTIGDGNL